MVRALIVNPLVVVLSVAVCFIASRLGGWDAHGRDLIAAAAVVLFAAELAVSPLFFVRGADQAAVAQAGLVGTVLHMLGAAAAGWAVSAAMHLKQPFFYMLLAFYWLTLISLSLICVRAVRTAPMARPIIGRPSPSVQNS